MNTTILSIGVVTAVITSLFKDAIELKIKPGAGLHDTLIRCVALLIALILSFADYFLNGGNGQAGAALEATAGRGLLAGIAAIAGYHLVAGSSVWDVLTPGQSTVLAPALPEPGQFVSGTQYQEITAHDVRPAVAGQPFVSGAALVPATVTVATVVTPVDDPAAASEEP